MKEIELNKLIEAGTEALGRNEPLKALVLFERAAEIEATPTVCSSLAYCRARERGLVKSGRRDCEGLIKSDPHNVLHYLNLGRILRLDGDLQAAIAIFRTAMDLEPHPQVIAELAALGVRKPQILGFLTRKNPLNKYLGRLRGLFSARALDRKRKGAENS